MRLSKKREAGHFATFGAQESESELDSSPFSEQTAIWDIPVALPYTFGQALHSIDEHNASMLKRKVALSWRQSVKFSSNNAQRDPPASNCLGLYWYVQRTINLHKIAANMLRKLVRTEYSRRERRSSPASFRGASSIAVCLWAVIRDAHDVTLKAT